LNTTVASYEFAIAKISIVIRLFDRSNSLITRKNSIDLPK